jgi:isocitrate lyase
MKKRNYTFDTVRKLQGSIRVDHTLARLGVSNTIANRHSTEAGQF